MVGKVVGGEVVSTGTISGKKFALKFAVKSGYCYLVWN